MSSISSNDPNDYPIFQVDVDSTGPIYINGTNSVNESYTSSGWVYSMSPCRLCGEEKQASLFPKICFECLGKVMDKVIKDIIPNTTEYCQDCFSHFKACKCPKKEAMDKLKS